MSNILFVENPNKLLDYHYMRGRYPKNYIKEFRQHAHLTLDDLADLADTSNPQISMLELGKRELTWTWAKRLAPHLQCNPVELFEGPGSGEVTLEAGERELLRAYRRADANARKMLHAMLEASLQTEKKSERKNARSKTSL